MNRRLLGLLLLLAVLGIARWYDPLRQDDSAVVAAVPRTTQSVPQPLLGTAFPPEGSGISQATQRTRFTASTGNAFKVRGAAPQAQVAAAMPDPRLARRSASVVAAVDADALAYVEPPLPPPPLQVIGTWDDGQSPGVFVAGPSGTLLARPGQVLLDDYKVKTITHRELVLTQLSNQRDWPLSIPAVASTPPMPLKK